MNFAHWPEEITMLMFNFHSVLLTMRFLLKKLQSTMIVLYLSWLTKQKRPICVNLPLDFQKLMWRIQLWSLKKHFKIYKRIKSRINSLWKLRKFQKLKKWVNLQKEPHWWIIWSLWSNQLKRGIKRLSVIKTTANLITSCQKIISSRMALRSKSKRLKTTIIRDTISFRLWF